MLTTTAVYRSGALRPTDPLDLPENVEVAIQIISSPVGDPRDRLMDDAEALHTLYAPFAGEDRKLAATGLPAYAGMLEREEASR
jgi:predicted DNA-binding antitoxin AbrB/MazE fold protein